MYLLWLIISALSSRLFAVFCYLIGIHFTMQLTGAWVK
jgi:hypothetical protein